MGKITRPTPRTDLQTRVPLPLASLALNLKRRVALYLRFMLVTLPKDPYLGHLQFPSLPRLVLKSVLILM